MTTTMEQEQIIQYYRDIADLQDRLFTLWLEEENGEKEAIILEEINTIDNHFIRLFKTEECQALEVQSDKVGSSGKGGKSISRLNEPGQFLLDQPEEDIF